MTDIVDKNEAKLFISEVFRWEGWFRRYTPISDQKQTFSKGPKNFRGRKSRKPRNAEESI